jgi:heptosyltransferase-1
LLNFLRLKMTNFLKILLIKSSSLGDVIHALPALTDAMHAIPGIRFDWVVEEAFQEIPAWHPAVNKVIPVALRRWRQHPLQAWRSGEWGTFVRVLRAQRYDLVLDSQGLLKSAWLACKARGVRAGFDQASAREAIAAWFYQRGYSVPMEQHAIVRQRALFARALSYEMPTSMPDSQLPFRVDQRAIKRRIIFLPGTTWQSKAWPVPNWKALGKIAVDETFQVEIVWGSHHERELAQRIADGVGVILPKMTLRELAGHLSGAAGVVGVDSGIAHLTAALGVPAVTLYGATDAKKTGAIGDEQENIQGKADCAPCLRRVCRYQSTSREQQCWKEVSPEQVWLVLRGLIDA